MQPQSKDSMLSGWDFVMTSAVELFILVISVYGTSLLRLWYEFGWLESFVVFFILMSLVTVAVLWVIQLFFPLKEGSYRFRDRPAACYLWNLRSFLYVTNLWLVYNLSGIIPAPARIFFYRALGAKIADGVMIGGRLLDPPFITIEKDAVIGDDSVLLAHAVVSYPEKVLLLGKIHVGKGAVVGARSMVMPGVTIGENSVIKAMSRVSMKTQIGAGEIWGGIPAVKEVRR